MSTVPPPGLPPTEVTRLMLERYALGRMREPEASTLAHMAAEDPELGARLAKVQAEIEAAKVDLPPLDLSLEPSIEATPPPRANRGFPAPLLGGLFAIGVAAAGALFFIDRPATDPTAEVFRGGFDVELTRIRQGQAAPMGALVEAEAGDRLQYRVVVQESGWLTVADVQDDGAVALWLEPVRVEAGAPAEAAVLLDDYAGSERVYFIVADEPVDLAAVQEAVNSVFDRPLADLDALPGIDADQQSALIVRARR